jgi:hypothetical protein
MSFIINPYTFASASSTTLLSEDFEGPQSTGWSSTAFWNDYYSTNTDFFAGDYAGEIECTTFGIHAYKNFTESPNVYCRFFIAAQTFTTATGTLATIRTSTGTVLATFGLVTNSNAARANSGGGSVTSGTGPTINTLWFGWFEYEKGTGSNAICRVGYTQTQSRPSWPGSGASGRLAVSVSGTSTANAGRIMFGHTAVTGYNVIVDNIEVRNTPFP